MIDQNEVRRANLVALLRALGWGGMQALSWMSRFLGCSEMTLMAILAGDNMPDEFAREVEWAFQKPELWMDEDHRYESDAHVTYGGT